MRKTEFCMSEQAEIVRKLISEARKAEVKSPGILLVADRGQKTEWYIQEPDGKRKYLSKKEEPVARALAQAVYAKKFIAEAERLIKEIDSMKRLGAERSLADVYRRLSRVYETLPAARQVLVKPYVLTDEQFVQCWEAEPYEKKSFEPDTPEIYTERGERVRSKSEKMIADKLLIMGVPYRYEYPYHIRGLGRVYADFTILNVRERRTVIYEHFGRMDDPDYCRNTLRKIDQYEKNGYYLGHDFLCTFESAGHILDMGHFEQLIREHIL